MQAFGTAAAFDQRNALIGRFWKVFGYNSKMSERCLNPSQVAQTRARRLVAMRLQEIEGNPLNPNDVAIPMIVVW